jgi:hypothetical protein
VRGAAGGGEEGNGGGAGEHLGRHARSLSKLFQKDGWRLVTIASKLSADRMQSPKLLISK